MPNSSRMQAFPLLFAALCLFASAPAAEPEPTWFIQLTDTQFGMFSGDKGFEQETANYEFAVASINRLKPAFVVVTGDLVNRPGDEAQIAEYLRISAKVAPAIPVFHVAGNHDLGNEPTPTTLAAFRKRFGRDYYGFRAGPIYGVVLDSAVLCAPKNVPEELQAQESWLSKELESAKASGASEIVVFQHHPYFLKDPAEPDQYFNVPQERRMKYLDLLARYGVRHVFAGHLHQNAMARYGGIEMVTTGPTGKPLGGSRSGMRIGAVTPKGLVHEYCDFGNLPHRLSDLIK